MKKEKNNLLILWTLRGLIKNLNKINIINPANKPDDLYVLYAEGFIKHKLVDEAELVWIDPNLKKSRVLIKKNITILIFNNPKQAAIYLKNKSYKYTFVRGNYKEFADLTNNIKTKFKMFYSADPEYWPTFWSKEYFDLIFVDEKIQIKQGKKLYRKTKITTLDKPVNDNIFKPQKVKKIYDVCYVSNFIFWKNHQLLFSALDKISERKKIKLVCAGKTFDRNSEIQIAAWKYHVDLTLKGSLTPKELSKIINQSKIGIIASEKDANPRTITETIACDVPLLVNQNLVGGKRLINKKTGITCSPDDFPKKILWLLKKYKKFKPNKFYKKHLSLDRVIKNCFIRNINLK